MANSSNVISESTKYVTIRIRVIIRNVMDRDRNGSPISRKLQHERCEGMTQHIDPHPV